MVFIGIFSLMSAILALEDGSIFLGRSLGVPGQTCGELVFNTAMTGYQEVLTDPSYAKQVINFTNPHIGNTGVNHEDAESSQIWAAGLVLCQFPTVRSNWRSEQNFIGYIHEHDIVGIAEVDTRFLTQKLRDKGSLNCCIMAGNVEIEKALSNAKGFGGLSGENLTALVSTRKSYHWPLHVQTSTNKAYKIVVYDFGVKRTILRCLSKLGCQITVVPYNADVDEVCDLSPEGILLSNGPGDPAACQEIICKIRKLLEKNIPIFGICLGYQLLALAEGAICFKMKFGHHGANHPVQHVETGRVLITSQNHGFTIEEKSLPSSLYVTHRSLFDGSLQGFRHREKPIYGFQGHPEASPGPYDAQELFLPFIHAMKIRRQLTVNCHLSYETHRY